MCWAEIWDIIGPQIEAVMTGGSATWHVDRLVPITRHGKREDVWWTYGYSPIQDADGVLGVLVVCNDVTEEHKAREELIRLNRQLLDEIAQREQAEEHLAAQLALADTLRGLTESGDIAEAAFQALSLHFQAARIHYIEVDDVAGTYHTQYAWRREGLPDVVEARGAITDFGPLLIADLRAGRVVSVADVFEDPRTASTLNGYLRLDTRSMILVPIVNAGRFVAMVGVGRSSPHQWSKNRVALMESVAERIWNAIERSRAYSQRLAAEQALNAQRSAESERLQSMFGQAPGFMCILNGPTHVFEFVNAAYRRLVGERPLLGKSVREAMPEVEGQGFFELLDQVFSTAKPFSASNVPLLLQREPGAQPTQTYIDFVYQPIYEVNGQPSGVFVEGFDATERYLAKVALEASEERLKEGMLVAHMVVWDWNLETGETKFSDNVPTVFGGHWTNINDVWQRIPPEDLKRLDAARTAAIAVRGSYDELVRLNRSDTAEVVWIHIRGKVVCDEQGEPRTIRGVVIDVTERKRVEEALRAADRHKDEFLAMLAHELRNPLAPISAAAQVLSMASHDERRVRETSEIISRQVEHMTSLIDDLLDVSRVTTGLVTLNTEPLEIRQIIAQSIEQARPYMEVSGHRFTVSADEADAFVMGDRNRLIQVFTNLLQNAAKFTPEQGSIDLTVENDAEGIAICVRDSGIGIDAELLPHIFDLFTQGKRSSDRSEGGLGLGLALVKSLVGLHNGHLSVASGGAGKGAIFSVVLPRLAASEYVLPPQKIGAKSASPPKRLRLLVVDDNVDAARTLAMFLEAAGHHVATEHESRAALARAEQDAYDVYLLDIGLPGMDGNELARTLRSSPRTAHATLIAVTGYGQKYDKESSIAAGFDYYFVKPADPAKLTALLSRIALPAGLG